MIDEKEYEPQEVQLEEWKQTKCDKEDYLIAVFCGAIAGLMDVFFVGDPVTSKLGKSVDSVADDLVKKAAQFFWNNDTRKKGKSRKKPQTLEQCISYLEQAFPVNYDARYSQDLLTEDGVLSHMTPKNHHLLSLAHSPDPIGLIFSVIDQFTGYATFVNKGKIIHVVPKKTSGAIPYMQGTNLPSMLFCGFVNWIGHLISDLAGSSSTRQPGKSGRGAGIPIPFYELFLLCDFGNIDGNTLSETMIQVFEEGYDFRFGVTMAIPVILEEVMIKIIWMLRQKVMRKKSWKESMPTSKHADLRIMLIVGNATLCAVDGTDAAVRGFVSGGNVITFICHLNLIGWTRLLMLVLKELAIRVGPILNQVLDQFIQSMKEFLTTPWEKKCIEEFNARMDEYDNYLWLLYAEYVKQVEEEYKKLNYEIGETFNYNQTSKYRALHSIKLAELTGVIKERIIYNLKQLDELFK